MHSTQLCRSNIEHHTQKWRVHRDVIIDEVLRKCGVNLLAIASDTEIPIAMTALEELRFIGVPHDESDH